MDQIECDPRVTPADARPPLEPESPAPAFPVWPIIRPLSHR